MELELRLGGLKRRMVDYLQLGLFEDPILQARALCRLRTEITQALVELEAARVEPVPVPPGQEGLE